VRVDGTDGYGVPLLVCPVSLGCQLDDGVQYTGTRKFFTLIPVVLFILATHGTDYRRQPLGLNLGVAIVLLVAKAPALHKVRIFGINKD